MHLELEVAAAAAAAAARLPSASSDTLAAAAAPSDEARYEHVVAACKSATEQLALALQREEACGGFVSRHVFGVEEAAHAALGAVAGAETSTRSAFDETCISIISMSCASASAHFERDDLSRYVWARAPRSPCARRRCRRRGRASPRPRAQCRRRQRSVPI